jgi:hypothetical protein
VLVVTFVAGLVVVVFELVVFELVVFEVAEVSVEFVVLGVASF